MQPVNDVERLLQYALRPVEPPRDMTARFERRLTELTDAALEEIADFDPTIVRSPRRWARVAVAGVVAGAAGTTLVLVRARQKHKHREARGLNALNRGGREVAQHVRRRLDR
jgi:hypothetical protein